MDAVFAQHENSLLQMLGAQDDGVRCQIHEQMCELKRDVVKLYGFDLKAAGPAPAPAPAPSMPPSPPSNPSPSKRLADELISVKAELADLIAQADAQARAREEAKTSRRDVKLTLELSKKLKEQVQASLGDTERELSAQGAKLDAIMALLERQSVERRAEPVWARVVRNLSPPRAHAQAEGPAPAVEPDNEGNEDDETPLAAASPDISRVSVADADQITFDHRIAE